MRVSMGREQERTQLCRGEGACLDLFIALLWWFHMILFFFLLFKGICLLC